ncbi:MAG TPA: DUF5615 family PIN-like protein [Chloroflexia bacterium]|nr:DUF5615 family PIN-like protein [Chloroflexia bacterium]
MRILLDECLPRKLKNYLPEHEVKTVPQMGWASIENGDLLQLAETLFDVFITVDRNMQHQQNMSKHHIAVVVLLARSNQVASLHPLMPALLQTLESIEPGEVMHIAV